VRSDDDQLLGASEMAGRVRALDWSRTPLGPIEGWPAALRIAAGICLSSRFPMFVWWGPELINIYNDSHVPIHGGKHPWALGRPAREVWADVWHDVGPQAELVMQEGMATWNERVYLRTDRNGFPEDTWFTWSYSPIRDDSGEIRGLFCACTEDTARVLAERQLDALAREQRLAQARDKFLLKLDDATRRLSDAAEITMASATLLGRHLQADRCAYADVEEDQDTMNLTGNYCRSGEVASIVGRMRFRDFGEEVLQLMREDRPFVADDVDSHQPPVGNPAGNLAAYHATQIQAVVCAPLHKDGKFVAAMAVHSRTPRIWLPHEVELVQLVAQRCWESLQRGRVTRDLQDTAAALQDADRAKDAFLATLSHELRNPLAPLQNAAHLLRRARDSGTPPPVSLHEMMERQLNHLVRLVDDLLEVSRISRGTMVLRKERVSAAAIARNALETSDPLIRSAGHKVEVQLPATPLWLEGDQVRLAQIVANLLNNAARYTEDRGRIVLDVRREADRALFSIRDNGIGISAEALPQMFEMFYRGEVAGGRSHAGLGIGLALARRLARMHGGEIEARSAGSGQGSEFILRLPLARDQSSAAPETLKHGSGPLPGRILVVDDNRDAADSLSLLLKSLGADVRVARDGVQALEEFSAYHPSVVLLDIGMPVMDGYEVARRIRAREPERATVLVALSGWGAERDRRLAEEAGFDHHLVKPADLGTLESLLATLA
jgi:signal transduction histidine kinase/CheY-like chemotaxis protein